MNKLLQTFFFGYASYKWRRLIRTLVIFINILYLCIFFYIASVFSVDSKLYYSEHHQLEFFVAMSLQIPYYLFIGLISYLIEPFIINKNESISDKIVEKKVIKEVKEKKIIEESSSKEKTTQTNVKNTKLNFILRKIKRFFIRVFLFFSIYIPLYALMYPLKSSASLPIAVGFAFYLSRRVFKFVIKKYFKTLQ